jgi:hypothetical protein
MKLYLILLKVYLALSGFIFFLVALLHLFRLLNQWPITVGESTVPQYLSYIGFPASTGYFLCAIWLFRRSTRGGLSGPAS